VNHENRRIIHHTYSFSLSDLLDVIVKKNIEDCTKAPVAVAIEREKQRAVANAQKDFHCEG